VCNGFLEGARTPDIAQALGRGLGANTLDMCKAYCAAHNLCNAVTFDVNAGHCWMETETTKPTTRQCDNNGAGISFWLGEVDGHSEFESLDESWQMICNGYIQGTHPGRHGLGQIDSGTSIETCQDACNAHWQCNTVVFDGTNCWIESIPIRPSASTCNDASWAHSYWKGPAMLTELDTIAPSHAQVAAHRHANLGTSDSSCGSSQLRFDEGCFYKCETDMPMEITVPSKKGMALDDTTLHWCPQNMHFHWPNTNEPVSSFRMFKAWSPQWNEAFLSKEGAWNSLNTYLEATNAQVLVGTQISCSEEEDDADWENVKAMMQIFGPEQIMGLAIGNELELLWTKTSIYGEEVLAECLDNIWNQGYFLNKFRSRVAELDEMFPGRNIPVTSVFGGFILAEPGWPFYERTDQNVARINTFINAVDHLYGERYVHTINLYPYFEEAFVEYDDPSSGFADCQTGLERALCMGADDPNSCLLTWMVGRMRQRLHALGRPDATLWLGETGWSYPVAHTLATEMRQCPEWSTPASKVTYYENFLKWDMEMGSKYRGPDHIFYFAMRDSSNFGFQEGFGLVGDGDPMAWCTNTTCEMQQSSRSVSTVDII